MLAIAGGKGGVGKTTTALGLAAALPGRPLVVDADRDMPDLHALAGIPRAGSSTDDAAGESTHDAGRNCPEHDCRVLPAPVDEAPSAACRLTRIRAAWQSADFLSESEPSLIDTPAGAGVDAATPLRVADGVVLVSTACAPALRDTAKTASMARAVGTPVVGAVLTRTSVRPPNAADLLDCPVLAAVPAVTDRPLDDRRVRDRYDAAAAALVDASDTF